MAAAAESSCSNWRPQVPAWRFWERQSALVAERLPVAIQPNAGSCCHFPQQSIALPASCLTPATLRGYIASEEPLPPVREGDGDLRRCGLTFHPHLAPGVRAAMDTWQEALPAPLEETSPQHATGVRGQPR